MFVNCVQSLWGSTDVSVFFWGKRESVTSVRFSQWFMTSEMVKNPCRSSSVILLGKIDRVTFLSSPVTGFE